MRKSLLFFSVIMVLITSCKKDEEEKVDDRDQFVGTYSGSQTLIIPALEMTETVEGIITITKSSEASKIIITDDTEIRKAYVTGNKYVYEKYSYTENVEGTTITLELTGTGTFKDGQITESGAATVSMMGMSFPGTWTSTFSKQ